MECFLESGIARSNPYSFSLHGQRQTKKPASFFHLHMLIGIQTRQRLLRNKTLHIYRRICPPMTNNNFALLIAAAEAGVSIKEGHSSGERRQAETKVQLCAPFLMVQFKLFEAVSTYILLFHHIYEPKVQKDPIAQCTTNFREPTIF